MARNKYRAMAMGKRALSLTLATSLSISTVAGVGATEISLESTDIIDNVEEEVLLEEENSDDLLHALEEKMTYDDIVALKDTLSDDEIIEMKNTLDGEVLEWFLEVFADEINAIENPEEEIEEVEDLEEVEEETEDLEESEENELENEDLEETKTEEESEEVEEETDDLEESEEETETEEDANIKDVVLGNIIESVETKLTYEELVNLKDVVTYREILLMKEHLHGETLEWFLEIFADEILLAETSESEIEEVESGLPQVDVLGGGSEGGNLLEETQEVMFMSENGIMMVTEVAPIEIGGFADFEAGSYLVPVSIKNISDTSIKDVSGKAIESAILTVDENGNGTLSFSPKAYKRNGFGSGIGQLTQKETYLSNFTYYTGDEITGYTGTTDGVVENGGKTSKAVIENVDSTVNAMYVSYTQNSVDGEAIDTLAYLEIDYANAGDVVYYFGEEQVPMKPGSYDNVLVSFTSVNSASGALSGTTGTLTVEDDGSASITVELGTYKHQTFYTRYIGDIISDNGGYVKVIEGTNLKPTKVEFEILDINSSSIDVTHRSYNNSNASQTNENQKGTFSLNYMNYIPEVEYDDEELSRRYTVGSDRTMFAPGAYDISAYFKKAGDENEDSMASGALAEAAELIIDADGNASVILEFQETEVMSFPGNGYNFRYFTDNDWIDGEKISAEILTTGGIYPRKIKVSLEQVHDDGVYIIMDIDADMGFLGSMNMEQTGYMLLDLSSVGEVYDKDTVTLRDGEDYWESADENVDEDGFEVGTTYYAPIKMMQYYNDTTASMGDKAFDDNRTVTFTVDDKGEYTVEVKMGTVIVGSLIDGISEITSKENDITIFDVIKTQDASTVAGEYISEFKFTTTELKEFFDIEIYVAAMGNNQSAKLAVDWDSASFEDVAPEIEKEAPVITSQGYINGETVSIEQSLVANYNEPTVTAVDYNGDNLNISVSYVTDNNDSLLDFAEVKTYLAKAIGNKVTATYVAIDDDNNESNFVINFESKENAPTTDHGGFEVGKIYSAPVKLMQYYNPTEVSMGDKAFDNSRNITFSVNESGLFTVDVEMGTVEVGTLIDGISKIYSKTGDITISNIKMTKDAETVAGEYISSFTFTTTDLKDMFDLGIYVSAMGNDQSVKMAIDWDSAVEYSALYYTFGSKNTMFNVGSHTVNVKVTDPSDKVSNSELLTSAIANSATLNVDGDGNGKVTLNIGDIQFGGKNYEATNLKYYTADEIDPTTLQDATGNAFDISNYNKDGFYISVDLGDSYISVSAYVEVEYTESATAEDYDASKVAKRVVQEEDNSDGNYKEGYQEGYQTGYNKGYLIGLNSSSSSQSGNDPLGDGSSNGSGGNSSDGFTGDIKSDGTFEVPIYLYHEKENNLSMGDDAFKNDRTTTIINDNGEYTFDINISTVNYSGLVGGIANITSGDGKIYDIQQEYSTDSNGEKYVSRLFFKTKTIQDSYDIKLYIPVMGSTVSARLTFDWNNLKQTSSNVNIQYIYVETSSGDTSSSSTETEVGDTVIDLSNLTAEELAELIASVSESTIIPDDITVNGQYLVPISLMHESNDQVSMGDPAFAQNRNAHVITKDGNYTVTISPSTMTIGDLTSGIGTLVNTDGKMKGLNILEYSKLATGEDYITSLQFTTNRLDRFYGISITVPNSPMGVTSARLSFDWDKAVSTNKPLENGAPITVEEVTQLAELGNDLVVENGKLKMTFDSLALKSINEQANGKELVITIEEIEDNEPLTDEENENENENENKELLNDAQKEVIGNQKSYYLQVMAGDEEITHFGDGKVTVELYHFLERNKQIEGITMWYVGKDGQIEEFVSEYDDYDRIIRFETNHFSVYSVHYDENYIITTANGTGLGSLTNASAENKASELPFEDVSVDDWFYNAVKFTYDNNIFAGTSEITFSPQDNITRASLITLLYRLAGSPEVSGRNQFTDVLSDQYYSKAILWAVKNNISSGYSDGTFGINDIVNREQMVTIVYNYGKYIGMDATTNVSLDGFSDKGDVADYAVVTFEWAIANGIISGDGDKLSPKGNTNRSEIATILMNLSNK